VGSFDGRRFKCDDERQPAQWVDFGRDFYAPVSWSDVPKSDGRRIWIGWLNNWETSSQPTHPWCGAMSIPRSLALRRTDQGLRLIQTPVAELQTLRSNPIRLEGLTLAAGETPLAGHGIGGTQLELQLEFVLGDASEFGLQVRKGNGQQTRIGYDVRQQELYVDRTQAGNASFHASFPGRHSGPLAVHDGRVTIHAFVDASSVEVFGGHGQTVITDCIFADPTSRDVTLYSVGGTTTVRVLEAWTLKPAW